MSINLPYVDEHLITIAAPRDRVWTALRHYADTSIGISGPSPLARILGTTPRSGFEVTRADPASLLVLAGRHRFSRYALVFELRDAAVHGTALAAKTYAEFPGWPGRMYRALVIGSRVHVLATNHMLRAVSRLCARTTPAQAITADDDQRPPGPRPGPPAPGARPDPPAPGARPDPPAPGARPDPPAPA